jgi:hypothetical protein
MTKVSEVIRGWLGWCPNAGIQKHHVFTEPVPETRSTVPSSGGPSVPSATTGLPAASRPEYQENILLILVLVGGLFCLIDLKMLAIAAIFSALLVYYDAVALHAGEKSGEESLFGNVVTWRPATWAVCVLIVPLIFLAIYTFSRKEIFDANI